jgi:hypothetical protein
VTGPGGGTASDAAAPGSRSSGIDLVSYTEVAGSPVFKLALQVVGERWYLYATHFWEPRISVLDVTDPAAPFLVAAIEGPPDTATWQVQVADGLLIQGMEHIPVPWGGDPSRPGDEGVRIFDVRDPRSPELLSHWRTGDNGVHRNHYTGGRYVHCAAHQPGFDGNIYVILDIQDPARPVVAGRWFVPEQFTAGGASPSSRISLHGPAYVEGDRAYLPYGAAGLVILDISDVTRPRQISRLEIGAAFSSTIAMHTAIPRPARGLLLVNTEAIAERSQEPYNFAGIVDITDETTPRLVSLLPVPVPDEDAGYPNFSLRGGRFGPHNQHHPQNGDPNLFDSDDLMFLTWFNAGLRVYDIRDEYLPREIASYLPDDPTERRGLLPKDLVTQSEDVLVDARGYIYLSDKNHGLHILAMPGL